MSTRPLTSQQHKVLRFVEAFLAEHGFPPTLREIGEGIGLSNASAVRGHVVALEKKGYVTKSPDKARSLRVVHSPSPYSRLKRKLHRILRTDEGVLHRVIYGLAWTTWRRTPHFAGPLRERMGQAIDREAIEHGWTILDKQIEPDHIVVVVAVWPNHSPEQTVRRFQAAGRAINRQHSDGFPRERLWGRGYAATTDLEMLDELAAKLLDDQARREGDDQGTH